MKFHKPSLVKLALLAMLAAVAIPQNVQAQQVWNAVVGAQSKDMARQAIAFLPNELWIHEGDSITWSSASGIFIRSHF